MRLTPSWRRSWNLKSSIPKSFTMRWNIVDTTPGLRQMWNTLGLSVLRIVANFFVLVFTGVMIWWGIEFTRFGWNQTSELADLPMWLIFIAWPFTGLVWLLFLVEAFARDMRLYRSGEYLPRNDPQEAM